MKHLDVDESVQPAAAVFADIHAQNDKYWNTYSEDKQLAALQAKELVRVAYFRSRVFLNSREKFLVVKVERPQKADAIQNVQEMNELHNFVQKHNIEVLSTKTSLLFRISK